MGHLYHGYVTNTQRVEATAPVDTEIVGTAAQSPQLWRGADADRDR